jgi:ArsR family transcriptional regulator
MELENLEVSIFKALAHPIRLKIIKKLREKTYCVCEMNEDVEFSQSNLSQHLKILRDAGLVVCEKEGMRINYRIKNPDVLKIINDAESMVIKSIKELSEKL